MSGKTFGCKRELRDSRGTGTGLRAGVDTCSGGVSVGSQSEI